MPFFRLFFGLLLILLAQISFAQLPNQAFRKPAGVNPAYAGELRLGVRAFGFFKNNEYFNKIADGYTLFGYQFMPSLQYFPSEKVKIEGGIMLWKDFGNLDLTQVQPIFTVTYQSAEHTLLFGTLNGNLNFDYIEPLWDFERQIQVPLQNGVQYLYKKPRYDLQAFIDWQVMQYPRDTRQEEVGGGFVSNIALFKKDLEAPADTLDRALLTHVYPKHTLNLPLQFTGKHKGGQIDVNDQPLTTIFNGAAGLEYTYGFSPKTSGKKPLLHSLYTKNYFVAYDDYSFVHQLPFQGGSGIYLNAGADTRFGNFMLSYWNGNGYISSFGGKLYQSVSSTVKSPGYIEKDRQLLIFRHMTDFRIIDGLTLTNRFEPFIDLNKGTFEFSTGFYVHFNTDFFLAKPKRPNPDR